MDTLNLFGLAIAFVLGVMTGACILYFGGLMIDRFIDTRSAEEIAEMTREEDRP